LATLCVVVEPLVCPAVVDWLLVDELLLDELPQAAKVRAQAQSASASDERTIKIRSF